MPKPLFYVIFFLLSEKSSYLGRQPFRAKLITTSTNNPTSAIQDAPFLLYFFLIAPNGATVRGSVFNMKFRVLSREFESIETSPGFAQLLGENWN